LFDGQAFRAVNPQLKLATSETKIRLPFTQPSQHIVKKKKKTNKQTIISSIAHTLGNDGIGSLVDASLGGAVQSRNQKKRVNKGAGVLHG
jgi:hypothetical protein